MSMPNWSYSRRDSPRPMPKMTRPFDSSSSNATFSAERSGVFHGTMTAPVPSLSVLVSAARCPRYTALSGQKE